MKVKILRRVSPDTESYWETFDAEVSEDMTVAGLLDFLNYHDDIMDETGKKTTRIGWECSCLQGTCGACAMVINGIPALACETMVKDLKGNEITIRPLQKFPVIHDLIVDRTIIHENLRKSNVYIGEYQPPEQMSAKKREKEHEHQYEAAKCLKCEIPFSARSLPMTVTWSHRETGLNRLRSQKVTANISGEPVPRRFPVWMCVRCRSRRSHPWRR